MDWMRLLMGVATCVAFCLALVSARGEDLAAKSSRGKDLMAAGKFEEAIPVYRDLVRSLPDHPGPLMNLGLALHMAGQNREALRKFQAVLRLEPNHLPARLFMGAAYLGLKAPAEAIAPLEAVIHAQPDNKDARLLLGQAFHSLERFQSAATQFEKASKLDHENPRAWNGLGLSYEGLASRNFVALEKTALGSPYWLVLVAQARAAAGFHTRAFLLYREAQAKMPTMRGIHTAIAGIYRRIGQLEWAAIEEEKERRLPALNCTGADEASRPDSSESRARPTTAPRRKGRLLPRKLECAFWAGRYDRVIALSKDQRSVEACFWRIRAYNALARLAFSRLAQLPPSAEAHELLATIHFNRRNFSESAKAWREALKYSPGNVYYRQRLAIVLSAGNDLEGARPDLEELVKLSPDSAELNFWLGHTLLGLVETEKAIPVLEKAVKLDPTVAGAHEELARAYLLGGQAARAIPHLRAALPTDDDGTAHYQLSVAYRKTGQLELAKEMLVKFRKIEEAGKGGSGTPEQKSQITPP